jgi:serpin B
MTMPIRIFSLCLVALWLLASHDASAQKRKRRPASRPASGTPATTSPVAKEPRMNTATAPRDAAAGVNRFAVTLHQRLSRQTDGNLFFSPYSISSALAMTALGARGATLAEMQVALQFPDGIPHAAFAAQDRLINTPNAPYTLAVANALWGQRGLGFEPDFLSATRQHYGAGLEEVDFRGNPEGTRSRINDWVSTKTNRRIPDLLPPGFITPMTRLVLTNAIYFKGNWAEAFDRDATNERDQFRLARGGTVTVAMMNRTGRYAHFDGGTFEALTLPYRGNELSMVILLPNATDGLPALEKGLTAAQLQEVVEKAIAREVQVSVPRFKLTLRLEHLTDDMKALGMTLAFTEGADFSAMTRQARLFIDAIAHKAFVEVNEEGTEAAAATGVGMRITSIGAEPPRPVVFRADHPFLFVIRDNRSGATLFMGRVMNPAVSE